MIINVRGTEYDVSREYFDELKKRYEEAVRNGCGSDSEKWTDENVSDEELEKHNAVKMVLSREKVLESFERMYTEIDPENHLFVGTINPQMVIRAINALRKELSEDCES